MDVKQHFNNNDSLRIVTRGSSREMRVPNADTATNTTVDVLCFVMNGRFVQHGERAHTDELYVFLGQLAANCGTMERARDTDILCNKACLWSLVCVCLSLLGVAETFPCD